MSRRRGDASPFSLFAFQDIITSVTGVIVLLALILTLELVTRDFGPPPESAPPTADIEERLAAVTAEIQSLSQRIQDKSADAAALAKLSTPEIERELDQTARQSDRLKSQMEAIESQIATAAKNRDKQAADLSERRTDREQLKQTENQVAKVQSETNKLKSSNRIIYNSARNSKRTAWLVQLDADGWLLAQIGQSRQPTRIQGRDASERLEQFLKWMANRDPATDYFLLLVRPNTIDDYRLAREAIEAKRFSLGYDLIGANQSAVDPRTGTEVETGSRGVP